MTAAKVQAGYKAKNEESFENWRGVTVRSFDFAVHGDPAKLRPASTDQA